MAGETPDPKIDGAYIALARRHWRYLAPSWSMPVVLMLFLVVGDISGTSLEGSPWMSAVLVPLLMVGALSAGLMQRRERLPYGPFYVVWIVPTIFIWIALVAIRAAILIPLGRPL